MHHHNMSCQQNATKQQEIFKKNIPWGQMAKDLGSTGSLRPPGIQYPPRHRNTPVVRSVGSRNGSLEPHVTTHWEDCEKFTDPWEFPKIVGFPPKSSIKN